MTNARRINEQELNKVSGGFYYVSPKEIENTLVKIVEQMPCVRKQRTPMQPIQPTTAPASPTETRHTTITTKQGDKSKFLVVERDVHGPVTM